jgi:hypothetical protein
MSYDHWKTTEPYIMSKYDEYTTEEIESLYHDPEFRSYPTLLPFGETFK